MTEAAIAITKLLMYAAMMGALGEPEVGVGAFYAEGVMKRVCEHRVEHGWTPGLRCEWYCLVSGIEQESLGEWWAVEVGSTLHLCHVVDVGATHDLPTLRARGEVIELSWAMAQDANWTGYTEGVKTWRLEQ